MGWVGFVGHMVRRRENSRMGFLCFFSMFVQGLYWKSRLINNHHPEMMTSRPSTVCLIMRVHVGCEGLSFDSGSGTRYGALREQRQRHRSGAAEALSALALTGEGCLLERAETT